MWGISIFHGWGNSTFHARGKSVFHNRGKFPCHLQQAGEPEAYAARIGGELLVNGQYYEAAKLYTAACGETGAVCGGELDTGSSMQCGEYDGFRLDLIEYRIPTDGGYWPMIFFVGGDATRDPVTGAITAIDIATIPIERRLEFHRLILRYKVMASWAALVVAYG